MVDLKFAEKLNLTPKEQKGVSGEFIIKGVIHITEIETDGKIYFESLFEDFFYTGLEADGHFLSQSDMDVTLEYELPTFDWYSDIEPELDRCYAVLMKFDIRNTSAWCGDIYEYDSEVEIKEYHIIPVSDEANAMYLDTPEQYFQFEE